ncbi:hypothetical protein LNP27_04240 [Flavobacterium galactosidilyticum]|uniref:hypothetical protein n=1 Tax=Flavobacterium galactosidilyticum TaxID=2893886 RepID=UPI001E2E5915|nr:hypothetical protein [Flavobacterium sp. F-340]UFH47249.1 hypothetical protein LNP27_04240 [Flavobacterium sp. F-340]
MIKNISFTALSLVLFMQLNAQISTDTIRPSNTEIVKPIHKVDFNNGNQCPERKQGGDPKMINGYQVFNGSMDGNRQVDPQVAVGGGYVMEGTNSGLMIFNKKGEFVQGVSQKCFNDGIDPKLAFDIHNKVFLFDLWWYYDKAKTKPVNISVSETSNPTGAWNTYPVSRTEEVDGGGIGYSKKWIGYSYPGGVENTFVLRMAEAKAGKPATIYHFKGSLGHPVFVQDAIDDLYFFAIEKDEFVIRKVSEDANGKPYCLVVSRKPHGLKYMNYPPQSPQKGTEQKVSSGDRNPKNVVYQNGSIWFSQAVNCEGRSAVQWHQINATTGEIIQTGLIKSDVTNYIQTTIAVNKKNDVLIGFQEVNENSFISPRFAFRKGKDSLGKTRKIVSVGEGKGATDGVAWGDYSGSIIDGDNLLDLWTIQSIANTKGRGETVIVKVPFK